MQNLIFYDIFKVPMINLKDFSDRLLTSHLNSIFPSKETTSSRFQKDLLLENVEDNFFLSGKNGLCGVSHSPCFPDLIHHSARIPIPSPSQGPHGQGADQNWHTDLPQEGPPLPHTNGDDQRKAGKQDRNSSLCIQRPRGSER